MPGLKKAFFAMQPRWLRPVERITTAYSTITFAISDPDGSITNTLLDNRAALFGKEVTVSKWIDKPILIQCSLCHALGHNKASRACPLGKDSVKCYKCGGTHKSENHDHHCYAQALGVVDIGSLSVELSWRIRVRSGRPSCRASQGQNHGVRRGYKGSGEVRQSA